MLRLISRHFFLYKNTVLLYLVNKQILCKIKHASSILTLYKKIIFVKKKYIYSIILLFILGFNSILSSGQNGNVTERAKYVFLFIGDGMGLAHISLTEAYLATQKGVIGNESFTFSNFPEIGLVSTFSANSFITCSSAAGTAIATGTKTNNYMLGVDPQKNNLTAITYKMHKKGIPIGIVTTVSIDQATPGAFYANSIKRSDYYGIALQIGNSGFEFFAGGGFMQPYGESKDKPFIEDILKSNGYKIAYGLSEFNKFSKRDKVILLQEKNGKTELPLAIDRKDGDLTLKNLVDASIDHLDNKKGFFIMAEGGLIDWTAHVGDAKSTILEILDMNSAIESAYNFYLKHPKETLIIVTADHETGGTSVGKTSGYSLNLKQLDSQKQSMSVAPASISKYMEYNAKSMIGWSTRSHTGIMVPIYSIGVGSSNFGGRMDNTDIAKKICNIMNVNF